MSAKPSAYASLSLSNAISGTALVRVAALGLIALIELAVATLAFDGGTLAKQGFLIPFIRNAGPWILRFGVCSVGLFVTFAYLSKREALMGVLGNVSRDPVRWGLLAMHAAAGVVFGVVGVALYGAGAPGGNEMVRAHMEPFAAVWLIAALTTAITLTLAFVSPRTWGELRRQTGYLWIYAPAAALLILFAAIPSQALWLRSTRLTFRLVTYVLSGIIPIVADPASLMIAAPHIRVVIAPECSGLEGAGLMLVFGTVWLWLFRKECRFPNALALLPIGVLIMFAMNVVRIAVLLLIGNAGYEQIAVGGFHSQAGWITFNAVAFGFCLVARKMPLFSIVPETAAGDSAAATAASGKGSIAARASAIQGLTQDTTHDAKRDTTQDATAPDTTRDTDVTAPDATGAFLMPMLAILTAGMLARAASGSFEWLYPLRFAAALAALWAFRKTYRELDWRFGWFGVTVGAVVFVIWMAGERFLNGSQLAGAAPAVPSALAEASTWARAGWVTIRALAAVTTVPIAEELAFRGYLLRRLVGSDFQSVDFHHYTWFAVLLSSAAFGALHGGQWVAGILAGAAYALAMLRTGRIGEAVIAHAVTNALIAIAVLGFNQYSLW